MKVVVSAVMFALVLVGGYYFYEKFPLVVRYRDCFNQAYSIINEEHIIVRRAHTSDEVICREHKKALLLALGCFEMVGREVLSETEKNMLTTVARNMAQGTKTMTEMVEMHNRRCMQGTTTIEYDPRLNQWF